MCCYVSGVFICEGSCFSTVAIEVKPAYSYSVTCSNHQFCHNCNYYKFETVQHCGEDNNQFENGPEWRSLVRIYGEPRHAVMLSAVSNSTVENCVSQGLLSPQDKPQN